MKPIRVLLVDDHVLVRAGIRSLVEKIPDMEVVGEAADGREALVLVRALQPAVVLMDIGMAGLNGLEATLRVGREFPDARVIILSMHVNEEYVAQALRAGAAGYLLKESATTELESAIRTVNRGEIYLCPSIPKRVAESCLERMKNQKTPLEQLTTRQREILQLVAEGNTTKEIGLLLKVSPKTVEFHRAQLMDRLNIHDVPGLVRFAMRTGVIPPE